LVASSVEKYYIALTEIQLKICRFHGSLRQKGSRHLFYTKRIHFVFTYQVLLINSCIFVHFPY